MDKLKYIIIHFYDENHEKVAEAHVFRVDINKLNESNYLSQFIAYHPNENGGFPLFKSKLEGDFAKMGAEVGEVLSHHGYNNADYTIFSFDYKVVKDYP